MRQTADEALDKKNIPKPWMTNYILALIEDKNKLRKIDDHFG